MAKYGKKTQSQVGRTMRKLKKGELKSGSGRRVRDRKQAIAIALSESREKGYKAPKAPKKKTAKKKAPKKAAKKTVRKRTASKKR
jgi:hypothetical protein